MLKHDRAKTTWAALTALLCLSAAVPLAEAREHLPVYDDLLKARADYAAYAQGTSWDSLPAGETIEPAGLDTRIPALRARLNAEGYANHPDFSAYLVEAFALKTETPEALPDAILLLAQTRRDTYDAGLVAAVQAFQADHGLEPDGVIGTRTLEALNETAASKLYRIDESLSAIDGMGALPQRFVWLNIPSYTAEAWSDGQRVFVMRAIVGLPTRETPVFTGRVEYVVANPSWTVPVSIFQKDKVPKLARDPGYAARNGYILYDRTSGKNVRAETIDWANASSATRYEMVQSPGANNALGNMKIIFPNEHSIYMHGTPDQHLFSKTERAYSSGCVRIEAPVDMAKWLAETTPSVTSEDIDAALSTGKSKQFNLDEETPVFVTYITVTTREDGSPVFWRDVYHRLNPPKPEVQPSGQDGSAAALDGPDAYAELEECQPHRAG